MSENMSTRVKRCDLALETEAKEKEMEGGH